MKMTLMVSATDGSFKPHTAEFDTDCLGEFESGYGTFLANALRTRPDMYKVGRVFRNGVVLYEILSISGYLFMSGRVYHLLSPRVVNKEQVGVIRILERHQRNDGYWYQFSFGETTHSLSEQGLHAFLTDTTGRFKLTQVQ